MTGELPEGWSLQSLGEVLNGIVGGGTPSKGVPEYFQGSIPLMTVKDMKVARPTATGFNITQEALDNSSAKLIPADTVVIATRMGLGKVVRPRMDTAINQDLKALFPSAALDKSFLELWLISIASRIEAMGTGTTVKGVRLNQIKDLEIPVAPTNEQQRIVEKIETLFAQLDKGEEAVREVQKLLKRYRQSILKSSVTGELTADWRAEREGELESGTDLLARILKSREETWQGRGKYKAPVKPDTSKLPDLPQGWVWASMEELFEVLGGATPSRREPENWSGSIPWVSSGEVAFCRISETREHISQAGFDSCSTKLHPVGTILLAMIGEGKTRGQAAILDIPACNNQNACAIRVSETPIPPEYIYYYLLKTYEENRLKGQGGNQPALSGAKVKNFVVPVCSPEEMGEICNRLEVEFSRIEKTEAWCETELKRSAALRQSILKDAFSGCLVPQDPGDEPASALLERIQQSKKKRK